MEQIGNSTLVIAGVSVALLLLGVVSYASDLSFTGFFKAFDVNLSPGEYYERNITVRKFYNVSVRFQKENSTSYLTFSDPDSLVVLKDSSGQDILREKGIDNGKIYETLTNYELESIRTVSAYNISDYRDVVDQPVNSSCLSTIGAKAYITVTVTKGPGVVTGYVVDDLTGVTLGGVTVAAFENDADTSSSSPVTQSVTDNNGVYMMSMELDSKESFDVYVDGYDVA